MRQNRAAGDSVSGMRAAVSSLSAAVREAGGDRVELAEWVARQRAARGAAAGPLVSSSAPASALAAWTELQRRRFDRRA